MRSALIACVCAACGSGTGLAIDARCNPLGDGACLTPWPSSVFEIDDPTTATGRRLALPSGALPTMASATSDVSIDPSRWNRADGFSPSAPIVVSFKTGISPVALPPVDNMDLSLAADSATVLLDMTTGERVAHHAALDPHSDEVLLLYPAKRLASGHRYAVAITNRVRARDGEDLPVSPGFTALREGTLTDHHLLEAARPRLDEALDALDDAGVSEDELVVAWDFTVASDSHALDTGLARLAATHTFDLVIEHGTRNRDGSRTLTGSIAAPLLAGGVHRIVWRALVPACPGRLGIAIYGHTLLGDAREVDAQGALAGELCRVLVAADLGGLSAHDEPALARMVAELDDDTVIDALAQGMLDQLALVQALRGELAATPLRARVDASDLIYVGASQHTGVLAAAPVTRGILFGGDPTTSRVLDRYRHVLARYAPVDAAVVASLLQMHWDAFELLPHQPVLLVGPADADTAWHARTLELPLRAPAPFTPWGLPVAVNLHTGVGFPDTIRGYAPCCDKAPCVPNSLACSALPRLP